MAQLAPWNARTQIKGCSWSKDRVRRCKCATVAGLARRQFTRKLFRDASEDFCLSRGFNFITRGDDRLRLDRQVFVRSSSGLGLDLADLGIGGLRRVAEIGGGVNVLNGNKTSVSASLPISLKNTNGVSASLGQIPRRDISSRPVPCRDAPDVRQDQRKSIIHHECPGIARTRGSD
ncbi:hypothetical protein [Bradyrhizobium mercantei]|uniref:hypothetical protein n=1 Tax=Bradyrhizobium mercantei TaxID=1904807 RepID=UPI0011777B64|nr:hypothetical protein [Bradyrhizobium mercantei]